MHIGVDGNLLCGKKTGMGTVVYYVLKYWKADNNTKIKVFAPEPLEDTYQKLLEQNGIIVKVCGNSNYFKWEQIVLPRNVKGEQIDVLWCPYNTAPIKCSCPTVVTVHDLIYMTAKLNMAPSLYKKAGILYRRRIVPIAVKRANRVITISQFAKQEICNWFPSAASKVNVVYNSTEISNDRFSNEEKDAFFKRAGIRKEFILGFGSLERRKNSLGLIKAYADLPEKLRNNYQLVLFGFRDYENSDDYKYITDQKLENIVILGYISEKEKAALYSNCKVFVFPTFSEGFGIPILEAFSYGAPVITSNVTAIPEIAGDAAILVNPNHLQEITSAIEKILTDLGQIESIKEKAKKQLQKFDWEKSSREIFNIIVGEGAK